MAPDKIGGFSRRTFVKGGLAASTLAVLAACKPKNDAQKDGGDTDTKKTLRYYINDPVAIDPYNLQESEGTQVGSVLFDPLMSYDWNDHKFVPLACESYEVSDDGTEFTFHLRKGAKFHDGTDVDAQSFKRGWERVVSPKMATPGEIGYHLAPVAGYEDVVDGKADELSGVSCPDATTLKVKLSTPMVEFLAVCAHPGLAPVPAAATDDPQKFLLAPIGNGPFKMDGQWVAGQYINVVRNDDYYGDKPKIAAINFNIQKDPNTAFREFEAGNLDVAKLPTGRLKELAKKYGQSDSGYDITPGKQCLFGPEASVYYLCLNLQDKTLQDVNLRRAMSLAIDRQQIVDTLFEGYRRPATSFFPPIIDEDEENIWEYAPAKPDVDRAKQIISEHGLEGTTVTLNYNSGGGHEDLMSIVQQNLEAIGLKVVQDTTEWATYLNKLGHGEFQIGRLGWNADYPTMDNFLYPCFFSTADNNYSKFNDPEVDKLILEARVIKDDDARKKAYRHIHKLIADQVPVLPIMYYAHTVVGSDHVKKLYMDPQQRVDYVHAEMS